MSGNQTNGFDIVVEVSEQELNDQIAILAGTGALPSAVDQPFTQGIVTGVIHLLFDTPVIDFDLNVTNGIRITMPFQDAAIEITSPVAQTIGGLEGSVIITDRVTVRQSGNTRTVRVAFEDGVEGIGVTFTPSTEATLGALAALVGTTLADLRQRMINDLRTVLENDIRQFPLSPPITVDPASTDPFTPREVEIRVVNDPGALDRDCLCYLLRTSGTTVGIPAGFTQSDIPPGQRAVVMLGNDLLLRRVVCPQVASALGVPETAFAAPCRLTQAVTIEGVRLESLEAVVVADHIRIRGRVTDSGFGWDADGTFEARLFLDLVDGAIQPRVEQDEPDVDVSIAWWAWIVVAGVLGIILGPIGIIIGVVVVAIVDAVLDGIASNLAGNALAGALGGVQGVSVPLGPLGTGLTIDSILLDDFTMYGSPIRYDETTVHQERSNVGLALGRAYDLDHATMSVSAGGVVAPGADLAWGAQGGVVALRAAHGAALVPLWGQSYANLSRVALEKLTYAPGGMIPRTVLPTSPAAALVLGVRTSEGRYAKVSVWRDATEELHVRFVTFASPVPSLVVAGRWDVVAEQKAAGGHESGYAFTAEPRPSLDGGGGKVMVHPKWKDWPYEDYDLASRGHFEAQPRLMAYPLDVQWCLDGHALVGEGTVEVDGATVTYAARGRFLTLDTEMGRDLDAELCVSAIDARGLEQFVCVRARVKGVERRGGRPVDEQFEELATLTAELLNDKRGGIIGPPGPQPDPAPFVAGADWASQIDAALGRGRARASGVPR